MEIVGLDPGFGAMKAATVTPVGLSTAAVPSVVGIGETDMGLLSLGNLGRRGTPRPDRVSFDGVTYLVGEHVSRFARPVQRMDFMRLSGGPELRSLVYAALARLFSNQQGGQHQIAIMVGLPVEIMTNREQGRAVLRSLQSWLVGCHLCTVNNHPVQFEVMDVKAMAQPAGTFLAWGLDNEGSWALDKATLEMPVAICDVGFNTLDVLSVQRGEIIGRYTGGDTAGIRRAAELVIKAVQGNYGINLSLHEADALLREREPSLYADAGKVNLKLITNQALNTTAAEIISFLEQRWGNGRQFTHLLFTGGGAEMLRNILLQHYPHGIVMPEPVMANAIGLARYAVRVFKP